MTPGDASKAVTAAGRWLARLERFDMVGSTNDVVGGWLRDGTPEVCLATTDVQAAGRGRNGRTWSAPAGAAVLASIGFRPTWLEIGHLWRLAAVASLAMAEAGEIAAGLRPGTIHLKWPNDLVVVDRASGTVRKLAGVLGETDAIGTAQATAVIGVGANAAWSRATFPPELAETMTSLSELAPAGTVDRDVVIRVFIERLEGLVARLRAGDFPAEAWSRRQLTNGMIVRLDLPDGSEELLAAQGVDTDTGALLVREPGDTGAEAPTRGVLVGEIHHLRVGGVV